MDEKVGIYQFYAESFQCDFTGRLSMGVLGNHILNVANMNASKNGFGITYLNEHNYTWVLSRLIIELDEMPAENTHFTIETWIESVLAYFSTRNFAIKNAEGKPIGYARTVWAMLDMNTRQPLNLLQLRDGIMTQFICEERTCPMQKVSKIRVTTDTPVMKHAIRYSDIDINIHMNSVRYIEHILDIFDMDKFREKRISRFEIAYIAEAHYGDTLIFYIDSDEATDTHQVEVRQQSGGEVTCRAKIHFE